MLRLCPSKSQSFSASLAVAPDDRNVVSRSEIVDAPSTKRALQKLGFSASRAVTLDGFDVVSLRGCEATSGRNRFSLRENRSGELPQTK